MEKTIRVTVKIPLSMRWKFKEKCAFLNVSQQEKLTELIQNFISIKTPFTPEEIDEYYWKIAKAFDKNNCQPLGVLNLSSAIGLSINDTKLFLEKMTAHGYMSIDDNGKYLPVK